MFPASGHIDAVNFDVLIAVMDDIINEAEEVFVVRLELIAAVDPNRVNLGVRNASLCHIGDNDGELYRTSYLNVLISPVFSLNCFFPVAIFIGFEFASYTYEEQDAIIPDPFSPGQQLQVIYLTKSIKSEQTFNIVIRATDSGDRPATFHVDYAIGDGSIAQDIEFRFDQDRYLFSIGVFEDDEPEGTENFQLISLQREGGAPFNPSVNATCTVFILDDNDSTYY